MTTLSYETPVPARASMTLVWVGRVISALPLLLIFFGAIYGLINPAVMKEGMAKYGYPDIAMRSIIIVELVCAVLYLIPQTAVLGAILLTGYLGGATATHVRASESSFVMPVLVGVLLWLGLLLRDSRLRGLLPFRTSLRR